MEKMLTANQTRAKQKLKNKKKQPLKVVYIASPIKFKTSASEFRTLVQELTGQDADMPESSRFSMADGVCCGQGEADDALKMVAQDNIHHHAHDHTEEVTKTGHDGITNGEEIKGSDPFLFGSIDDVFFTTPQKMENFQGIVPSNLWH